MDAILALKELIIIPCFPLFIILLSQKQSENATAEM